MMSVSDTEQARPAARGPALVVAGMHRSGTSAMARVLSLAGGALPERVIEPGPDNPLGFWEPWEMVALSDEILAEVGSSWDDIFVTAADAAAWDRREAFLGRAQAFVAHNFGDRPLPVLKDPRASVLTRLWRQSLVNNGYRPVYVIMVRHPLEVAGSLAARDGFPTEKSLLLWTAYMLAVERDTRGEARVFVAYPDLIADWRAVLDRIETAMNGPLPARNETTAVETDAYLSLSQRHHDARDDDLVALGVVPVVQAVHAWMQAAAAGQAPDPATIDVAARSLNDLRTTFAPIRADEHRGATELERALLLALADAEARLLRARGHAIELELGLAERQTIEATLTRDLEASQAATKTAQAKTASVRADLRAAHLSMTSFQTELAEQNRRFGELQASLIELQSNLTDVRDTAASSNALAVERLLEIQARDIRMGTMEQDLETQRRLVEELGRKETEWRTRAEGLEARIEMMKRSLAWKVARPVRVIEGRLKRAKSPGG